MNDEIATNTTAIVNTYILRHDIEAADLPRFIRSVRDALAGTSAMTSTETFTYLTAPEAKTDFVAQIKPVKGPLTALNVKAKASDTKISRSIQWHYLRSFEDGKYYARLGKHLSSRGLTPAQYRAKWGLPADYPMVAPASSSKQSNAMKERWKGGNKMAISPMTNGSKPSMVTQ